MPPTIIRLIRSSGLTISAKSCKACCTAMEIAVHCPAMLMFSGITLMMSISNHPISAVATTISVACNHLYLRTNCAINSAGMLSNAPIATGTRDTNTKHTNSHR